MERTDITGRRYRPTRVLNIQNATAFSMGDTDVTDTDSSEKGDSVEETDDGFSRRNLLIAGLLGAAGVGTGVFFSDELGITDDNSERFADNALAVWREIETGLKQSPDHLPGTAEELVAEGDPKAIYEFVRDQIITQPPTPRGTNNTLVGVNSGPRGVLRCGMGTPREKAELLAVLLERAGYETTLYQYNRGLSPERFEELYFSRPDTEFNPAFTEDERQNWDDVIPPGDVTINTIDQDGADSVDLATEVRRHLPTDTPSAYDFRPGSGGNSVAVVGFHDTTEARQQQTDAETVPHPDDRLADLFHADESFGTVNNPDALSEIPPADETTVTVTLETAKMSAPDTRETLVSKQYDARTLVGRQLNVGMLPSLNPFDYPNIRFTDINRFIPSLTVQDPYASKEELDKDTAVGDPIEMTGDRIVFDYDGSIRKGDQILLEDDAVELVVTGPDGTEHTVEPVQAKKPVRKYFYGGPVARKVSSSTRDGLEREDTVVMFFYQNVDTGRLSLVTLCDKPESENNGAVSVRIDGLGSTDTQWLVQDGDPTYNRNDRDSFTTTSGEIAETEYAGWQWGNGNDGGAIGPMNPPFDVEITILTDVEYRNGQLDRTGIDRWLFVNGEEIDSPIELSSVTAGREPTIRVNSRGSVEEGATTVSQPDPSPAVSDVADIELETDVGGYPEVELRLDPVDENGETVTGVTGADFSVTEDERPVGARVKRSSSAPKVIVYYDTSLSVILSGFYPKDDNRQLFRQRLREDIKAVNEGASVEFYEAGSDSWSAMADAARRDGSVIMYIADADGYSGSGSELQRTAIREGPTAVMLTTDGNRYDVAEEMAELSGGRLIPGNSSEEIRDILPEYLNNLELKSYGLGYRTPNEIERGVQRTVRVEMRGGEASSEVTYTIPSETVDARSQTGLCGLYLSVSVSSSEGEIGTQNSVRTLAGYDPQFDDEPTTDDITAVKEAAFGKTVLSFESAGVPLSVRLGDEAAGRLTLEPMLRAALTADSKDEIDQALKKGIGMIEPLPERYQAPLPDRQTGDSLTYTSGIRTVLTQSKVPFGTDRLEHSVDLLNTGIVRTVTRDTGNTERQFRLNMERTARLAVLEREQMDTTPATLLSDAQLTDIKRDVDWDGEPLTQYQTAVSRRGYMNDMYRIGGRSGTTAAHWAVDQATGELTGILPDGSGGGEAVQRIRSQLETIDNVVSAMGIVQGQMAGAAGGTALGMVVAYQALLARLYALASIAIATMDASNLAEDAQKEIAKFLCNMIKDLFFDFITPDPEDRAAASIGPLNDILSSLAGDACGKLGSDTV
jgi:hypothetical protein